MLGGVNMVVPDRGFVWNGTPYLSRNNSSHYADTALLWCGSGMVAQGRIS